MKRETAWRVFAGEYNDSSFEIKGEGEMTPSQEKKMNDFFVIKSLSKEDQDKILREVEKSLVEKKKEGTLTDKEIQEIEIKRLHTFLDVKDVQSVYENFLFERKEDK